MLHKSSFLDKRMTAHASGKRQVQFTVDELVQLENKVDPKSINFIFHTSFCRSTLMSKALHVDNVNFSLKEPSVLLSLAESIRFTQGMNNPAMRKVALPVILKLITGLIHENESVLIKPTNFANNILPEVVSSGAKVLLMYSDLKSYLISILKYGESGRGFARQLYTRLMVDCDKYKNMKPQQALLLTDLQIATMVWRQQMELFVEMLTIAPDGQIATLSSEVFKNNQSKTLQSAFDFFEIQVSEDIVESIINGPVFQQHSKSHKNVDNESIERQTLAVENKYQDEIEATLKWAEKFKIQFDVTLPLKNNLL